jgi:hypothetical protein
MGHDERDKQVASPKIQPKSSNQEENKEWYVESRKRSRCTVTKVSISHSHNHGAHHESTHVHGIPWARIFPKRISKRVTGRPARRSTQEVDEGGDEDMVGEDETIEVTFPRITAPKRAFGGHDSGISPVDYASGTKSTMARDNRYENPYINKKQDVVMDHRFWNLFQCDWYISVIKAKSCPIIPMKWVHWQHMHDKRDDVLTK